MSNERLKEEIKRQAKSLGFDFCGFSKARYLEEEAPRLEAWLKKGMHGQMKYMENHFDKRLDPRQLVPGARSVISLLMNYYTSARQPNDAPRIAMYALGNDYHQIIKKKLRQLLEFIRQRVGDVNGRVFVDSAPVLERGWGLQSGLGWMGKNTQLINPKAGSYYFLAEIILDVEFPPDTPMHDYCGTCQRCMEACPTNAIIKPYVVDASRCISYFTIELRDEIPQEYSDKIGNWLFGCDICQQVCPWNRFSKPHTEPELNPLPEIMTMTTRQWIDLTEEVFNKTFKHSPLKRTGYKGIKRNLRLLLSKKFLSLHPE
jgi:epoxyqueuosine reductase